MRRDADDEGRGMRAGRRALVWAAGLWLLVFAVSAVVIASGRGGPSEASDQDKYHLVVIEHMAREWPAIDISDYPSATAPGYHALMAGVASAAPEGARLAIMRLANAAIGSAVPALFFFTLARLVGPARAAPPALALACGPYVLGGAIYLTTDNLALLFVLTAVGALLAPLSAGRAGTAGAASVLAVAVRQVHVWTLAPLLVAAAASSPAWRGRAGGSDQPGQSWRPAAIAAVLAAAAAGLLGGFVWLWGGLTPPSEAAAKHAGGPNPASPALALALAGVFAPLLAWPLAPRLLRETRPVHAAIGAAAGLAAALAVPTSFELKRRAYGWLWVIVQKTPVVAERSVVLAALAAVGGACLAALWASAARRGRGTEAFILATAGAGWLAAQSMNSMAWQRYFEPLVLVFSAWLVGLAWGARDGSTPGRRWSWARLAGPAALVLLELAVTAATLGREILAAPPARF